MKRYLEYLYEEKGVISNETFAEAATDIQEKLRKFSSSIISGFESIQEINNRTETKKEEEPVKKEEPVKEPVKDIKTELPDDKILSFKKGQVYNYQGKNNKFFVKILKNDGKSLLIQDVDGKFNPWKVKDLSKFGKEIKDVQHAKV